MKSIINPARTETTGKVAHYFIYVDRKKAVTENRQAVAGESTREVSVNLLRINHYFTRSRQERLHKIWSREFTRRAASAPEEAEERDQPLNAEVDEILVPYEPTRCARRSRPARPGRRCRSARWKCGARAPATSRAARKPSRQLG